MRPRRDLRLRDGQPAMSGSKHLVYLFKTAPYDSFVAQEGLDALLAAAAFGQQVSLLFIAEGVYQLLPGQQPQRQKSQEKMLQALTLYDVEHCFVHAPSLAQRGVDESSLCLSVVALDDQHTRTLIASADHVLTF